MKTQDRNTLIDLIILKMNLVEDLAEDEGYEGETCSQTINETTELIGRLILLDGEDSDNDETFEEYTNMLTSIQNERRQKET